MVSVSVATASVTADVDAVATGASALLPLLLAIEELQFRFYATAAKTAAQEGPPTDVSAPASGLSPGVRALARQFAGEQEAHRTLLRRILGAAASSPRRVDLTRAPGGPLAQIGATSGLLPEGTSAAAFDDDAAFLLTAYFIEDVGVSAYRTVAGLLTEAEAFDAVLGALATEAGHAASLRSLLQDMAPTRPAVIDATERLAGWRSILGGVYLEDGGIADRPFANPVGPEAGRPTRVANLLGGTVPTLIHGGECNILNILFLASGTVPAGGFFPDGVDGPIRTGRSL